ncbi:MAG: orotate phosphoribosyltransferase [Flavobacteriaceae bacterium]|nr:orotate phosphoribosyltransferase [Flavobacteriaceae bacterium]
MIHSSETAKQSARILLEIEAVKFQPENPFTWASGWKSPIYCDNRVSLSFPKERKFLANSFAEIIKSKYNNVDYIAGVATGAIAIGVLVADILDIPFVYVRPEPKKHGRKNQIEGYLKENSSVIVIEDLISTGKSSLDAVSALKTEGANVLGMLAIFSYGFDIATENFKKYDLHLDTLTSYDYLIEQSVELNKIDESQIELLKDWRKDPSNWKK